MKLNNVEHHVDVLLGASEVLEGKTEVNLLIANINRNILLNDLPTFRKTLGKNGEIILSGFYIEDITLIEERACQLGLVRKGMKEEDGWAMLLFEADASGGMDI